QRSENSGARQVKLLPKVSLRDALVFPHLWKRDDNGAVSQIRIAGDIVAAVPAAWPRGIEQPLLAVRVQLSRCETAAGGQPAERTGQPGGEPGEGVQGEHPGRRGGE